MTSVLLTGASGFAGSHLLEALLEQTNWDVTCLDSLSHNGMSDRITAVAKRDVQVIRHDLSARLSSVQRAHIGYPDFIINMASQCQVDQSIHEPAEFISNNVELILTMLELARTIHPQRFIQFSTDEVYGMRSPHTATDHTPSNPYAASKAAQEDICHAYARTYDLPVTIINSANMFGERQSLLAFIPKIIRAVMLQEKLTLHVPGMRRYTYVRNMADHLVHILPHPLPARLALRGQYAISNSSLAFQIASQMGMPLLAEEVPGTSARPGYDLEYAELPGGDWSPAISFAEGIARTVSWALENPEWFHD